SWWAATRRAAGRRRSCRVVQHPPRPAAQPAALRSRPGGIVVPRGTGPSLLVGGAVQLPSTIVVPFGRGSTPREGNLGWRSPADISWSALTRQCHSHVHTSRRRRREAPIAAHLLVLRNSSACSITSRSASFDDLPRVSQPNPLSSVSPPFTPSRRSA